MMTPAHASHPPIAAPLPELTTDRIEPGLRSHRNAARAGGHDPRQFATRSAEGSALQDDASAMASGERGGTGLSVHSSRYGSFQGSESQP